MSTTRQDGPRASLPGSATTRADVAADAGQIGIWELDLESNRLTWDDWMFAIYGRSQGDFAGAYEAWRDGVHPDDREAVARQVDDALRSGVFDTGFRVMRPDGEVRYVRARAKIFYDSSGKPLRMVGTNVDVTELELAREHLRKERNRAQQYFAMAGTMLLVLDRAGRVVDINRRGCEILGVARDAVVGNDWIACFVAPRERARIGAVFAAMIGGDEAFEEHVSQPVLCAGGEERVIDWHNTVLRNEHGAIVGTLSSGEDVTVQREAQRAVDRERAFLQAVIDGIDDPVLVIDTGFRVQRMNAAARRAAAHAPTDGSAPRCYELAGSQGVRCGDSGFPCPMRQIMGSGEARRALHRQELSDGRELIHEISASPLRGAGGNVEGVIEIVRDVTDRTQLVRELRDKSASLDWLRHRDTLTGLPNRALISQRIDDAIAAALRGRRQLAVVQFNIRRFREINDSYSRTAGDTVLQAVASRLSRALRRDDVLARVGGDDFLVLLPAIGANTDAERVADNALVALREAIHHESEAIFVDARVGIAIHPMHGDSAEELLAAADSALHHAKKHEAHVHVYDHDIRSELTQRMSMATRLHGALAAGELRVFYQPQFDTRTLAVVGLEALLRWQHPQLGLVPPGDFIPLAEELGLIVPIGEYVLRAACRQMRAWRDARRVPGNATICVNLSQRQFDEPRLVDTVTAALDDSGLPPANLELEITETTVARSAEAAIGVLRALRDIGVRVAIDDFGTGYSSLNQLKHLPLTKLKIDQGFVRHLPVSSGDAAICRAIISLAASLGIEVLAEGIETREQQHFLAEAGCSTGQGFLHSRPLPAAEIAATYLAAG